jgi:hypothetical protein
MGDEGALHVETTLDDDVEIPVMLRICRPKTSATLDGATVDDVELMPETATE